MEFYPIFGDRLYAFKYPDEDKDEFKRLFDHWQDLEYLEEFFSENEKDLRGGFWGSINTKDAIFRTIKEAQQFENILLELAESAEDEKLEGLDDIFKPLNDSQTHVLDLNKSKARCNRNSWLRIYALKIEPNVYMITGGAIKLTKTMNEREHTLKELSKLDKCRRYLLEQGIIDNEGVIEELES